MTLFIDPKGAQLLTVSGSLIIANGLLILLILLIRRRRCTKVSPLAKQNLTVALSKTRENIWGRLKVLLNRTEVTEIAKELEKILYTADLGVATATKLLAALKEDSEQRADLQRARTVLIDKINNILPSDNALEINAADKPYVIMVVGVNGVGKTTTIGKLVHYYKAKGLKPLLAAADTYRKAAIEQLVIWGERNEVPVVRQDYGSDPGAVAFDAIKKAIAKKLDLVIVDTAGRLHTKTNLMEELKKIKRVCHKAQNGAPDKILLVIDATTGQNAISQATEFDQAVGLDGVIVTKLDGSAKGGVVVGIADQLPIKIPFIGIGEAKEDLKPFNAKQFVEALFKEEESGQK